jgi:hypothetical protein
VHVGTDFVSVTAAYPDLVCVCMVHCEPYTCTPGSFCYSQNMPPYHWKRLYWHAQLNKTCNFGQVLVVAPWWWFLHEPKHFGAAFVSLVFKNLTILYIWVHLLDKKACWAYWFFCGHKKRNCKPETHWCHWYNLFAVFHVLWIYNLF